MSRIHLITWLKGHRSCLVVVLHFNSPGITNCDTLLLQSGSGITKSDKLHFKVYQALQCLTVIIKWDVTPLKYTLIQMWKVRHRVLEGKVTVKVRYDCKFQTYCFPLISPLNYSSYRQWPFAIFYICNITYKIQLDVLFISNSIFFVTFIECSLIECLTFVIWENFGTKKAFYLHRKNIFFFRVWDILHFKLWKEIPINTKTNTYLHWRDPWILP